MQLQEYPRPKDDNGRGIHWFTTQSAPDALVDTYIAECQAMNVKWVLFLNGLDWALYANDYLVDKLIQNEMMPILRVLTHPTGPLPANLPDLVRHYSSRRRPGIAPTARGRKWSMWSRPCPVTCAYSPGRSSNSLLPVAKRSHYRSGVSHAEDGSGLPALTAIALTGAESDDAPRALQARGAIR